MLGGIVLWIQQLDGATELTCDTAYIKLSAQCFDTASQVAGPDRARYDREPDSTSLSTRLTDQVVLFF